MFAILLIFRIIFIFPPKKVPKLNRQYVYIMDFDAVIGCL